MTGPSPTVMRFNERLLARHLLGAGGEKPLRLCVKSGFHGRIQ